MTHEKLHINEKARLERAVGAKITDEWWTLTSIEAKQLFLSTCVAEKLLSTLNEWKELAQELRKTTALVVTTMAQLSAPSQGSPSGPEADGSGGSGGKE